MARRVVARFCRAKKVVSKKKNNCKILLRTDKTRKYWSRNVSIVFPDRSGNAIEGPRALKYNRDIALPNCILNKYWTNILYKLSLGTQTLPKKFSKIETNYFLTIPPITCKKKKKENKKWTRQKTSRILYGSRDYLWRTAINLSFWSNMDKERNQNARILALKLLVLSIALVIYYWQFRLFQKSYQSFQAIDYKRGGR